ncbi:acetyltransferase [Micromonospora sp. NPDC005220]|uniref:acetyltransferase n=1 Tax=Micromonospora sp. NPDC005220 TaxID=3155589 RepID=UPI0033BAAE82
MTNDLVLVGAGGMARETAATVAAINAAAPTWRLRGFLDDDPALHGVTRAGLPVLGPLDAIADLPDAAVVVCIANARDPGVREQVVRRLGLPAARYATVVHPSAEVPADCTVGPGSVLLAQVVLTADVTVGAHVAIMPQTVLTHDDVVSDHVTIASGVRISGSVRIGPGAYLGAGALIRESLTVGARSLVGMGSVVLSDIPPDEVWAGNPARFLRVVRQPTLQGVLPR